MLFLRFFLFVISFGFVGIAIAVILYDVYLAFELDRVLRRKDNSPASDPLSSASPDGENDTASAGSAPPRTISVSRRSAPRRAIRWASAVKLLAIAAALSLLGKSILVVPDGHAAVRISQISGVRP